MNISLEGGAYGALIPALTGNGNGALVGDPVGLFHQEIYGGVQQVLGGPSHRFPTGLSEQAIHHHHYHPAGAYLGESMSATLGAHPFPVPAGAFSVAGPAASTIAPNYGLPGGMDLQSLYQASVEYSHQRLAAFMEIAQAGQPETQQAPPELGNRQDLTTPGTVTAGNSEIGEQTIEFTPTEINVETNNSVVASQMEVTTTVAEGGQIRAVAGELTGEQEGTLSQSEATNSDGSAQTVTTVINTDHSSAAIVEDDDGEVNTSVTITADGEVTAVNPGADDGDDVTAVIQSGDSDDGAIEAFGRWISGGGNDGPDINLENVRATEVITRDDGVTVIRATLEDGSVREFEQPGDSDDNWVERAGGWIDRNLNPFNWF